MTTNSRTPARATGVWKSAGDPRTLLFSLDREPTDSELRSIAFFASNLLTRPADRSPVEQDITGMRLAIVRLHLERVRRGQSFDIEALLADIDAYLECTE